MTGLFDEFRRHFVVLTKFMEYEVESRPYGPRWAPAREEPGRALQGPDRARRVGSDRPRPPSRPLHLTTHSTPPAGVFRGPLRCQVCSSGIGGLAAGGRWGTRYYPPGTPTRYTPPGTIPSAVPAPVHGRYCSARRTKHPFSGPCRRT